jgi:hypothetical protein
MPSALCYRRTTPEDWVEHFCLVNPTCHLSTEDAAYTIAEADLQGAFAAKAQGGSDKDLAEFLRGKGYVNVDGFRIAKD